MKKKYRNLLKIDAENTQKNTNLDFVPKKKKNIAKNVLKIVFNTIRLGIYISGSAMTVGETSHVISSLNKVKSNKTILKEAELLEVDTDILAKFADSKKVFVSSANKLVHNGQDPIYVSFSKNISEQDKEIYLNALNFYENLFKEIDDRYKFKEVSEQETYMRNVIGQTVIHFDEQFMQDNYGKNRMRNNIFKWDIIRSTNITINKNLIKNNSHKYSVIVHELAHSFGFGDGFTSTDSAVYADTFLFCSRFNLEIGMIYPNDLKLLHILYNKNLSKDNVLSENEIRKINKQVAEYEDEFYKKAARYLKEKALRNMEVENLSEDNLDSAAFVQNFFYKNPETNQITYGKNSFYFDFDNHKLTFKILDLNNKNIYETQTDFLVKEGMIFIPSLNFEKGPLPELDLSEKNLINSTFFAIYKTDEKFKFYNFATGNEYNIIVNNETPTKNSQKNEWKMSLKETEKDFKF